MVAAAGSLLVGGLVAANRNDERHIEQALATQMLANQLALLDDTLSDTPVRGGA